MGKRSRKKSEQRARTEATPAVAAADVGPATGERWSLVAVICLLVLTVIAIYSGVGSHEFINYDDPLYAANNPEVQQGLSWHGVKWAFTTSHAGLWQPLTWLSLMLDAQLFGPVAGRMLMTNVALHAANSALLFLLFWRLTGAMWRSATVAALFAVHPQHVESVAWVTERKDVLSTFFFLLTLLFWSSFVRNRTRGAYAAALAAFALGLMSKAMLVTLPFVLLLLDYWPLERFSLREMRRLRELVFEKWPFFVLIIPASIVTFLAQRVAMASTTRVSAAARLANAFISYIAYLSKMFVPIDLVIIYPYRLVIGPGMAAAAFLLFAGITVLALWAGLRRRYLLTGWLWYAGTLVPVIGIVQVGVQSMADRFTYIPSIGIFVAMVWLISELASRSATLQRAVAAGCIVLLVVLALAARKQTGYWQSSLTVFQHAVDVVPDNGPAQTNLGGAFLERKDYDRAFIHYSAAVKASDRSQAAHFGLGLVLHARGQEDQAAAEFRRALQLDPTMAAAERMIGEIELTRGNSAAAIAAFDRSLAIKPSARTRGAILLARNDLAGAISAYEEALRENPADAELENNLAAILARQGRNQDALDHYLAALRLDPLLYDAHMNVGALLSRQGRDAEALTHFSEASRLKPSSPEPLVYLALLHSNQGRRAEAAEEISRALGIDEKATNQILTSAIHVPFKESNARDYLAFLQSRK